MLNELAGEFLGDPWSRAKARVIGRVPGMPSKGGPELTIVVPTVNERDNVGPLIDRLDRLLTCGTSRALIDASAASADSAGAA